MAIGGEPDEAHPDPKIKAAVGLTKTFVKDHHVLGDADFAALGDIFSEKEIAALCAFMAFMAAAHKFGVIMNVLPESEPDADGLSGQSDEHLGGQKTV
jgi:alkylhydroperoxidase family enzyme